MKQLKMNLGLITMYKLEEAVKTLLPFYSYVWFFYPFLYVFFADILYPTNWVEGVFYLALHLLGVIGIFISREFNK